MSGEIADMPDRTKEFLTLVFEDGGATAYNKWANSFEADVGAINYIGYKSVVSKWQSYHDSLLLKAGETHKVFDAGCGTGLVGEFLAQSVSSETIQLYGGDTSSEMLKLAQEKAVYTDLQVVNLKEELPYEANSFDSVISAGVFLKGHCGAECLPHIMRVVKPGCVFITTVTQELFGRTSKEWKKHITESNCELVEKTIMPYHYTEALVFVFRKN